MTEATGGDEPRPARHLAALRALHSVTTTLHSCSDLPAALDLIAQGVVRTAGFAVCAVNLRMPDDQFEVVTLAGDAEGLDSLLGNRNTMASWTSLLDRSEQWGTKLRFLDHVHQVDDLVATWTPKIPVVDDVDAWHPEDSLFAPLRTPAGDWLGVLSVDLPDGGRRPQPWQLEVLEMFADSAAIAMTNTLMLEASTHAATHDPLTGLPNRALLTERAEDLRGADYAVLAIDLDGFKAVNDNHGHQAGDQVLVAVANRMRRVVRDSDLVARVGGDEFIVLLAHGDEPTVIRVRERLDRLFAAPLVGPWGTLRIAASLGLASAVAGQSFSELLDAADADMYRHKRQAAGSARTRRPDQAAPQDANPLRSSVCLTSGDVSASS